MPGHLRRLLYQHSGPGSCLYSLYLVLEGVTDLPTMDSALCMGYEPLESDEACRVAVKERNLSCHDRDIYYVIWFLDNGILV